MKNQSQVIQKLVQQNGSFIYNTLMPACIKLSEILLNNQEFAYKVELANKVFETLNIDKIGG